MEILEQRNGDIYKAVVDDHLFCVGMIFKIEHVHTFYGKPKYYLVCFEVKRITKHGNVYGKKFVMRENFEHVLAGNHRLNFERIRED
jgi:hypothetical protein